MNATSQAPRAASLQKLVQNREGFVMTEDFRFAVGALVSHRDQDMPAIVITRQRAGRLGELYGIRRQEECEVRDLVILGEVLVPLAH